MRDFEASFNSALQLRDIGKLKDAVVGLEQMLIDFPGDARIRVVHGMLGGFYLDLRRYKKAFQNFQKATTLNPKSELASLGLYISYVKLNNSEKAFEELCRYLTDNPAVLYKATLEELLEGLKKGYMTKYKKAINDLARRNEVSIKKASKINH